MAVVTEKIIDVEIKGVSSVKELKNEIKELRDRLVRLDETSEDYKKTVDELIEDEKKLTSVMRAGKNEVSAATGSYNALSQEMSALKKVWKEVTSEAERSRIGKRIAEINVQLKAMDASIGNFQRNVGDYEGAIKRAFMTPQQEIKKLRVELAQLEEGTEEYNRVFMRMSDLTTKVQKQQELLRFSSADLGNILGNLAGVASSVVGGFSAINAAMGLMGNESEDVQQAMLKVQRLMALVQGLSALENLGDKINGLWSGIKRFIDGFRGGTAAVTEFDKATKEAAGTTEQVSAEMNTQAATLRSNAAATNEKAEANKALKASFVDLKAEIEAINQEYGREVRAVQESTMADNEKAKAIDRLKQKRNEQRHAINEAFEAQHKMTAAQASATVSEKKLNAEVVKTNNIFKLYKQNVSGAAKGTTQYTAATGAATVGTKVLTGAVNGLKIALSALGIGLIIAGLTALLGLLGKGLGWLWKWVSGINAANAAVEQLKNSQEQLNLVLEDRNEKLDFESRLMEAQGKTYDEIYNYKKQETTATLNLVKAQLAEAQAQAVQYEGKRRFKKQLEETMEVIKNYKGQIKDLEKTLRGYDQDREIHLAQEANKPKGGGGSSYDSQLKAAQNLYKQLQDFYKTDRQKLRETYEENKKTIEKYIKNKADKNKALLLLDKKYYDDLKELTKKNMDAIYGIYMGQENRRLALMNVWDKKYLERAKKVLDEEQKIALAAAAKKVGFEEKTDAEIAKMDKASQAEYLKRRTLYNNEKLLINEEYARKNYKLVEENNERQFEEERRLYEVKKLRANGDEELLAIELEFAYKTRDFIEQNRKLGESEGEYTLRLEEAEQAIKKLLEKQKELAANKDWTQLRLDNDAEAAKINDGDQSMQYLNARLKAAQYYYDNLKQLEGESMEEYRQRTLEALAELRDTEREILQQRFENYSNLANGIGDIFGSIADMYQTEIQAQKDADGQYNAESKQKFEWVKRLQIAQATIQTISGAIAAFMSCQSLGFPYGQIIGAVQAAAVTAAGIAQIAQIRKTKLDGSSSTSSSSARYAVATPSITDYNPQGTTNLTGGSETQDLANALSKTPIQAFVVESQVTAKQELAKQRTAESTF